jgi:broad specificity phosphatase PhoE
MVRIFLVRHGEVAWNRANAYVGALDVPLNDTGLAQARAVADFLSVEKIDAVYSSVLSRARVTAQHIAERHGLKVQPNPALNEVNYGEWDGVPEKEVEARYPELVVRWRKNPVDTRIPCGETFGELMNRAYPEFCRIADSLESGNIVVVAHKSTNRVILCRALGIDVNEFRLIAQDNVCVNVFERRTDGFTVQSVNLQPPNASQAVLHAR